MERAVSVLARIIFKVTQTTEKNDEDREKTVNPMTLC